MKRSIKLFIAMLLVATIALPSVFATGLGTSSSLVKAGTVDTTDVNYNVDIEWGSLVYNFIKVEDEMGSRYEWEPEELEADKVKITNYSNIVVKADVQFNSAISSVYGQMDSDMSGIYGVAYTLLTEEPEDFNYLENPYYLKIDENGHFVTIDENDAFEEGKYYRFVGAGGGISIDNGNIPALTTTPDTAEGDLIEVSTLEWVLTLEGGTLSDVRPGATIGTLTVTLS